MTGETANGRSTSVTRSPLPRNRNFATSHAVRRPKTRWNGTTSAAVRSVSRIAARAFGSVIAARYAAGPLRSACAKTDASGRKTKRPRNASAAATSAGGRPGRSASVGAGRKPRLAAIAEAPARLRVQRWRAFAAKTRAKDARRRTTAIAVAPASSNCSSFVTMRSGAISVFIGRLPEMKTIDPYSPSARANASVKPVRSGGRRFGKTTRRNACRREAPRTPAASSSSGSRSWRTGWTARTTNGRPTNVSARTTPAGAKATFRPSGSRNRPIQPFGE